MKDRKHISRQVKLESYAYLVNASKDFVKDLDYWLNQNNLTVKDIVGGIEAVKLCVKIDEEQYTNNNYPALYAEFKTFETNE